MKQTDKLIQSKLKDFEANVPEDLWKKIECRRNGGYLSGTDMCDMPQQQHCCLLAAYRVIYF